MSAANSTSASSRSSRRRARLAIVAMSLAFVAACASRPLPELSPVTSSPTGLVLPGKFVWIDLVSRDVDESKRFYGQLFGWTFQDGVRYVSILHEGTPIAGIVTAARPEFGSEWVGNLSVADVDRAAAFMTRRGGKVERGPLDAPHRGRLALVRDPDEARVLLVRATGGDPPDVPPAVGRWLWRELWTHDVDAAVSLYSTLGGYEPESIELDGQAYHVLKHGDLPRAGVVEAPPEVNPLWLPYVRVQDAKASAGLAERLGARIVLQDDRSAILVDPGGAPFGIQVWSGRTKAAQ
jgi:predicted enzyme related to lactoylglutathione lyase